MTVWLKLFDSSESMRLGDVLYCLLYFDSTVSRTGGASLSVTALLHPDLRRILRITLSRTPALHPLGPEPLSIEFAGGFLEHRVWWSSQTDSTVEKVSLPVATDASGETQANYQGVSGCVVQSVEVSASRWRLELEKVGRALEVNPVLSGIRKQRRRRDRGCWGGYASLSGLSFGATARLRGMIEVGCALGQQNKQRKSAWNIYSVRVGMQMVTRMGWAVIRRARGPVRIRKWKWKWKRSFETPYCYRPGLSA